MGSRPLAAALLALAVSACTTPALSRFEAALAAQDSATAALTGWCGANRIASPARITAQPVIGENRAEPPGLRGALAVGAGEPLAYRHVRLSCGSAVLSEAHNWYVPARLTPAMNAALAGGNTPFGTVAAPLRFTRERLEARRGALPGCPADTVLSHRAMLRLPDGQPLAVLLECYTPANLRR